MLKRIWNRARTAQGAPRASMLRMAARCEALETRQMLSGTSADYVLSGYSWSNPAHITYSFPADGTPWDGGTDNLNATMAAQFHDASWVRSIAKALQTWASVANINVVPVADSSAPFNTQGLSQGDPRFGDVRIGGYNFQSSTVLAQSYNPPPNGLTGAGDVEINTGFYWGPNAPYDLYSVLIHETGLALGMGETTAPTAIMNRIYGGVRTFLEPADIAGIQAIYGPRVADPLQTLGQATAPGTAFDVTSLLAAIGGGQAQTTIGGLSLDGIGDTEYFSVVAPAGGGTETLTAVANSQGISSLSPAVIIYNAAMQPIAGASNPAAWSNGVIASAGGIVPGQRYIVAVTGATNDVFSVGAYNFQLTFQGITSAHAPERPDEPDACPTAAGGAAPAAPTAGRFAEGPFAHDHPAVDPQGPLRAQQHRGPDGEPRHLHRPPGAEPDDLRPDRHEDLQLRRGAIGDRRHRDENDEHLGRRPVGPDARPGDRPDLIRQREGRDTLLDRPRPGQLAAQPGLLDGDRGRASPGGEAAGRVARPARPRLGDPGAGSEPDPIGEPGFELRASGGGEAEPAAPADRHRQPALVAVRLTDPARAARPGGPF